MTVTTKYSLPEVAKALGAFVVTLGTTATVLLGDDTFTEMVPKSVVVILGALVTAGVVAGAVFGIPNATTKDQVVKGAVKGGEPVVTEVVEKDKEAGISVSADISLDQLPDVTTREALEALLKKFKR